MSYKQIYKEGDGIWVFLIINFYKFVDENI